MPYFDTYVTNLSDVIEELRDILSDLSEEEADLDVLSDLYAAEGYLVDGVTKLRH